VRWRFFFWEALASIRSNAATTVAATVTVLIVTFLLGIFVTTAWWVYHYAVGVRNEVTVKLYLPGSYATNTTQRGVVYNQVKDLPYVKSFRYILYFVFGLMLLLGIAAVVLIQNTIRLSIFSRRREIEVMKLVGATNAFVRLPFMLEGMLSGMLGAVGAVFLLAGVYVALNGYDRGLTDPARLVGVPLLIAMLAMFGLLLGAFGSGITLRRFLRI